VLQFSSESSPTKFLNVDRIVKYLTSFFLLLNCNSNIFVSNSRIRGKKNSNTACPSWLGDLFFQRLQGRGARQGKRKSGKLTSSDDGLSGAGRHIASGWSLVYSASFAMFPTAIDHEVGAGGRDDEADQQGCRFRRHGRRGSYMTMRGRGHLDGGFAAGEKFFSILIF
jgi:hypothetical protein